MNITRLVKGNFVTFNRFRQGVFYYTLHVGTGHYAILDQVKEIMDAYEFQVPIEDIGDATLQSEDKAITFMRWIRKSIEDNTFIKL